MFLSTLKNKINASLFVSAAYFIIWSLIVIIFPGVLSTVVIESKATPIIFWDFMGLVTLILGVVLMIAAFNPFRHWLIILLVTLFHISMIGGFIYGYNTGVFNKYFINFIFFNHLLWIFPNIYALYVTYKRSFTADELLIDSFSNNQFPLEFYETIQGNNIGELNVESPLLLVFLRHFGCPFCKESLMKLAENRHDIEVNGIKIVLVYMVEPHIASKYLRQYELNDVFQVSDPEEIMYKSFKLKKGSFTQLFGLKVWGRWIELGVKKKLFNTAPEGNVSQMPGIFLLHKGKIEKRYVPKSIADSPDYSQFLDFTF